MPVVISPANKPGHTIDQVWMAISCDEQGEGLCAIFDASYGGWMPLVAADEARLESIRSMAIALSQTSQYTGKVIKLIKLSTREELETIGG